MAKRKSRKGKKLKRLLITLLVLVVLFLVLCYLTPSAEDEGSGLTASGEIAGLELPAPISGEQIITHTGCQR